MTKRRFWLLVHRVNGLLIAVFVTVVGLTGSLLAWKAPLERLFAPALFVLAPYRPDAVRVDPLRVRENVVRAFPWASVDSLDLSTVAGAPLEFSLTPTAADSPREANDEAFADPYTGRVLGSRRYADLSQGWINFVPFVYILHQNLALGDVGEMLLGLAALLWTLDCFVGMYLTFPASHRWVAVSRRQRPDPVADAVEAVLAGAMEGWELQATVRSSSRRGTLAVGHAAGLRLERRSLQPAGRLSAGHASRWSQRDDRAACVAVSRHGVPGDRSLGRGACRGSSGDEFSRAAARIPRPFGALPQP